MGLFVHRMAGAIVVTDDEYPVRTMLLYRYLDFL